MNLQQTTYTAVALDPIHVGTGGERLGRVDLTVVREPVTRLPKIPGTSLSGAAKAFADLSLRDQGVKTNICASVEGSNRDNKHTRAECPICCAFGYTVDGTQEDATEASAKGTLHVSDAQLLCYPVNTLVGPVWLTTAPRLRELLGIGDGTDDCDETYRLADGATLKNPLNDRLNFGWALLEKAPDPGPDVESLVSAGLERAHASRVVVVSEWVFSHLVNDNMEVRTSVVIDPETGAAMSKGLFTYEAVARGAVFVFSLTEHDHANRWASVQWNGEAEKPETARAMLETHAFGGLAAVGLGGMTTRGFGRLRVAPTTKGDA